MEQKHVRMIVWNPIIAISVMALIVFTMPPIVKMLGNNTYTIGGVDTIYLVTWFFAPGIISSAMNYYYLVKNKE